MNIISILAKIIIVPLIAVLGFAGYHIQTTTQYQADQDRIAEQTYTLQQELSPRVGAIVPVVTDFYSDSLQAGVTKTATSMTLVKGYDGQSVNLSGTYGFVIDQGSPSQELVMCTASGTALTACVRGLDLTNGTSTVAALEQVHNRGASVQITTGPVVNILANIFRGIESIGAKIFYDSSIASSSFSDGHQIPDKDYVDSVGTSGCATAGVTTRGCVQQATPVQAASTTPTGSSGAPLFIPTSMSTSSPGTAGLYSPVTQNNGKLAQSFLDLTQSFIWTALHTFSAGFLSTASSTITATTTIAASSVTNNALVLNGIPYRAPTAQGVAGTVYKNDGSGNLSWGVSPRYQYIQQTDFVSASGFSTSTQKMTIPAGIATASSTVDFFASWENGQATCILYLSDDATGKPYTTDIAPDGSTNNRANAVHILVNANSSLSAQQAVSYGVFSQTSGTVASTNFVDDISENTSTINWANAFTIDVVLKGNSTACSLRSYSMIFNP